MEPRQESRGFTERMDCDHACGRASMEPRHESRGFTERLDGDHGCGLASMEPRHESRGFRTALSARFRFAGASLQWSLGMRAEDSAAPWSPAGLFGPASMEPRHES